VRNAVQHTVAGLLLQIAVTAVAGPAAGLAANVAFWIGRERRDYELRAGIPVRQWWRGWEIWRWTPEDLWPPIAAGVAVYLASIT
jgi:hypothetical protein